MRLDDPRVSRFAYYSGGGLTFVGFIPRRDQDEFGIAGAAEHYVQNWQRYTRDLKVNRS